MIEVFKKNTWLYYKGGTFRVQKSKQTAIPLFTGICHCRIY